MSKNLIVVGAGTLGCRVAHLWKDRYPDAAIYLKTKSENAAREGKWKELGFNPLKPSDKGTTAPYVIFSAPPSGK